MKQLLLDFLWSHLRGLGAFRAPGQTPEAARESAGLAPAYGAWFDECLRLFEAAGRIERRDGRILLDGAVPGRPIEELWREWETVKPTWQGNPDLAATHLLVETTLRVLPDILGGRRPATEVLFPGDHWNWCRTPTRPTRRRRSSTRCWPPIWWRGCDAGQGSRLIPRGSWRSAPARVPRPPSSWRHCGRRGWTWASTATPTSHGSS
ncbi:hypothetical protein ACFQ60_46625 [Streptomyces zhihengii]